jgi:hypothetical protein
MNQETRRALVQKYKAGYQAVTEALESITEAELDARPAPDKWTARELVHHLADSEMTSAIRLRLLIAEDHPAIRGYDQDEFSRRLYYDRPIEASLAALKAARQTTSEILDRLSEAEWKREGTHSESGRYSVENWLEIYAVHAHDHAQQIVHARKSIKAQTANL